MGRLDVQIKLKRDFVSQYNKLQDEFGAYMARLNGFGGGQLSYTDFIDNFIDRDTVADASIDSNSNVSSKDIVTLEREMSKPHKKLLSFNKIYYEIQKKYGFYTANKWLRLEWIGTLYMHDADSASFRHYCFTGDTNILTDKGIYSLGSLNGQNIRVLNKHHGWEDASVQYFGKAEIRILTLERYGITKQIKCTGNHRWFVKGKKCKEIYETDQLKPGMVIPNNTSKDWAFVNPSPFGVAHGFFIGDGSKMGDRKSVANFCGDKISLIPYFTPGSVTGNESEYQVGGIPNFFNYLPDLSENKSYLYGWLSGYFAADGCVDEQGRCTLSSTNIEYLNYCRNIMCILGMPVNEIRYQDCVSNLTNEIGRVYTLTLSEEFLKEDFFIRPQHKERIMMNRKSNRKNRGWTVVSVVNTGLIDDVFCAVVPGTQSFTLDNNVLTHNCFAYTLKDVAEKGLYFLPGRKPCPAKHLITFVDFIKEFINYSSNRSSGAVGLPDLLPYMFYFWKKDVENDYLGIKSSGNERYYADQAFQRFIYAVNQNFMRDSTQSAFTNTSVFDRPYFEALFGGSEFPDGTFMIDYEEEIIEFQKWYMKVMSEIRSETMFTFPVSSISLLKKTGAKEDDLTDDFFVDPEFAKWAIKHNMIWSDSNLFIDDSVTSLSNCCRLKSDISNLGYFNSIGGTALKVGSVKVGTINLARVALESESEEEYLNKLREYVNVDLMALDRVRYIIRRNVEKGLLPNFSNGLVDFEHLYNTIGFIGIYESMKKFGYTEQDQFGNVFYKDEAYKFGEKIFHTMREVADKFIDRYNCDYQINTEQIPGESAADKLMKKDKFFYGDADIYDLPLYGNQFIPLGIQTTGKERIKAQAAFDSYCNGGSILHYNIDAPFTNYEKAMKLTKYIAAQGVTYFAFNTRIQTCEDNHAFYGKKCPVCGKSVFAEYTRIAGFYTKISSWSEQRKEEYKLRKWATKPELDKVIDAN